MNGNDKTMKTEPGGESTQYRYEGALLDETNPPKRSAGQLGARSTSDQTPSQSTDSRGEKTADNIRYGQNISESGMGGMTNSSGSAGQEGGYGGVSKKSDENIDSEDSRKSQGYGSGSGVGA